MDPLTEIAMNVTASGGNAAAVVAARQQAAQQQQQQAAAAATSARAGMTVTPPAGTTAAGPAAAPYMTVTQPVPKVQPRMTVQPPPISPAPVQPQAVQPSQARMVSPVAGPSPIAGAGEDSYFMSVSRAIEETPVLGFFYGLGASFGRGGTAQKAADFMKTTPGFSAAYESGNLYESRKNAEYLSEMAAERYEEETRAGRIVGDEYVGTQEQYDSFTRVMNAASTARMTNQALEAQVFGNQTTPATMPLALWATGAGQWITGASTSLIQSADTVLPAAAPLTHFIVGTGEGVAQLVPFAAMVVPAAEWAARNPNAMTAAVLPGLATQAEGMVGLARSDTPRFAGNIAGMLAGGKIAADMIGFVRYGRVDLPIERPLGFPESRVVPAGYSRVLESVKIDGMETFNRAATGTPAKYVMQTRTEPIQYTASWRGLYIDTHGEYSIFGRTLIRGSPYEGKIPLVGISTEAGGQFLGAMRSRPHIGPALETVVNLPGVRSAVGIIERSSSVPTGLWAGKGSLRNFGASIEPRISGAIDFLGLGQSPDSATLKLRAASAILPAEDVAAVQALIDLRSISQEHPGLITLKESYGDVTPVSMKPQTFRALQDYMNANPENIRVYGSLVGRTYHGEYGRASLGDVDALLKSSQSQSIAEKMWSIYLENEFGTGTYQVSRTESLFSTKSPAGKIGKITNIELIATDIATGQKLSALETVPSQITDMRITGTTPTGAHALDLHPITDLKFKDVIPGTTVKSIPIQDLIWGKQTIGSPPIGTVIVSRSGTASVVVEMGGRVKDFFDTYAFARTAAGDSYVNPRVSFGVSMRLEEISNVLGARVRGVAGTEPQIAKFLSEAKDPFTTAEVQSAKMTKILGVVGRQHVYSGLPVYGSRMMESAIVSERVSDYLLSGPIIASRYYAVATRKGSDYSRFSESTYSRSSLGSSLSSYSLSDIGSGYESVPVSMISMPSATSIPSSGGPVPTYSIILEPPYTPPPYVPPYTPPGTPPGIPPWIPPNTPPGTPPHLIPPDISRSSDRPPVWWKEKRKKRPARFVELFSFEMGLDTPVPRRFGLGGVTPAALARNPRASFIPGYRGVAGRRLAPEDIAPNSLYDILGTGKGSTRKRRQTYWEDLLS